MNIETVTGIGRLLSRSTSGSGQVREYATFTEDPLGNTTAETRYLTPGTPAGPVTSTWRYDSAGDVLQQQDPEGAAAINTFDNWGELTQVAWTDTTTLPSTDRRIIATYDALGRVVHHEERNGGLVNPETVNDFQYDAAPQVSPEVQPTYLLGRLAKASAPSGQSYYSYDEYGATNATTWVDENGARYVETDDRRKDGTTLSTNLYLPDTAYVAERVDYHYDSANRVASVTYAGPSDTRTLYKAASVDPFGRILGASYGAATYHAEYDSAGRRLLRRAVVTPPPGGGARDFRFDSYDPVGRELSRFETLNLTDERHVSETYDALGRLATSTQVRGASTTASWKYAYDPLGNVTKSTNSITGSAGSSSLTSRAVDEDQACRIGYPTPTGTGCNVTHDFVGNVVKMPTRTGIRTLGYFLSGQVQKIRDGVNTATFRYDPFGAVQELDVTGTTSDTRRDRHYGSMIEVRNQTVGGVTSAVISRSIPGPGGLLASLRGKTSSSWVFSFGDARGLRFTTDATGNFLQDVAYQPFGEATSTGPSPGSPLYSADQWNGGDALAAFGLSHLGARLYDPVIGRFLSRDPLTIARTASTSNPYAFAANDPVNHSDPTGLDWQQGCIGIECQGLQWQLPFDWLGGGGGGGARPPSGARPPPPPPVAPPMTEDASSAMWPGWSSPSKWERITGAVSSAAHSFGRGWMWTMGHVDRGVHEAVNFVDDHAGAFVAGGVFVVTAFAQPELLIPDFITTSGAGFGAWFSEEEPVLVDGAVEEATLTEQTTGVGVGDSGVVCRGGTCTAERFSNGSGVKIDGAGRLQGVSVNTGETLEAASVGIPNGQVGVTTTGQIRAAGGTVVPSPTLQNPNHAIMSGVTPEQAEQLFTPTVPNPHRLR